MFEKLNDKFTETDRDRGRRVGKVVSILDDDKYMIQIEGYDRTAKLNARFDKKYRAGDMVKLEPVGFNNRLEITGRTGARRYGEKLIDEQLQELLQGSAYAATGIAFDDSSVAYESGEDPLIVLQQLIDYLLARLYATEARCLSLEQRVTYLESLHT